MNPNETLDERYLDDEEKDLIDSIEKDEWRPVRNEKKRKEQARQYAAATLKKDKRMNIRMSERDMKNLKVKALEEGIPYQTLVSMILHKYLSGTLVEQK